jgi:4-hydroxyproline epimerase
MRIPVIDSHTEGEPTRVVIDGGPDLGSGSVAEQASVLARDHDDLRRGLVLEPRGSDIIVGAFLVPSPTPGADLGVIFVNNAGVLGMCVHGTIGVVRTLQHLGRASTDPGTSITLDTPVGVVAATVGDAGEIAVENVPSRRTLASVPVELDDRVVHADVAWGGNWFALVSDHGESLDASNIDRLTAFAWRIRRTLDERALDRGPDGSSGPVDHVELFSPSPTGADSRNFVLCPGGAYDRSPCGTGTSAKLACLAAAGELAPGDRWVQESIIGSRFTGWYRHGSTPGEIVPTVAGRAWITAESTLVFEDGDPARGGDWNIESHH